MSGPVTLFTGQWADLTLEELARPCGEWGFDDSAAFITEFGDRIFHAHVKDSGMDRDWGAPDALAFVRRTDFSPSQVAFDAAFAKEA
jgi:sugar phosphate isomerase/epimerase